MSVEPLLSVDRLSVEFATERGWLRILDDVSFEVGASEIVGLVGESGSGKSVTSLAIMNLLPPQQTRIVGGKIGFDGRNLLGLSRRSIEDMRGRQIAMIFQEPMTSLNPAFSIGDQISTVVRRHWGWNWARARARAREMLDLVGIPAADRRLDDYPHQFSGGMRQRVMIALALACQPRLLIADEPTTALDVTIQAQILDLLRDAAREMSMSVLFITHNFGVVADICERVIVLYAGQVVEEANVNQLFEAPLHPYSSGLLRSTASVEKDAAPPDLMQGSAPPPWDLPVGCRFKPRCECAVEVCMAPVKMTSPEARRRVRCVRAEELDLSGAR